MFLDLETHKLEQNDRLTEQVYGKLTYSSVIRRFR